MKKIIILLAVCISILACNTKNQKHDKNFTPWISYIENGESTEVRLNLPNGGSKVIYNFDEPILKSGKRCSYTTDIPFEGTPFLNGDTTYQLVNTSYSKTSGGRYNMIFIYQKLKDVFVFMEMLEIEGLVDSKLLFKGNIFQTKSDALTEAKESISTENIKKSMNFVSDDNSNESIKLVIDGRDVSMEFYQNEKLHRMIKGTYNNNNLLMDDEEVEYVLSESNLCYHLEGIDYCYSKTSEKVIQ